MNLFLEKSLQLANEMNYLDLLSQVYPIHENENRSVSEELIQAFIAAYKSRNDIAIVRILLLLERSPINNPYITLLRGIQDIHFQKENIQRNPFIVQKIAQSIYNKDLSELIAQMKAPINISRQMGPMFKNYLLNGDFGGFSKVTASYFSVKINTAENMIVIDSDKNMKDIATNFFGYKRNKGIDFLAKTGNKIILGEAKFFSINGGSQNNQMLDALSTLKQKALPHYVMPIAILDGACWFYSKSKLHTSIVQENPQENIFSALLLRDFLKSLL